MKQEWALKIHYYYKRTGLTRVIETKSLSLMLLYPALDIFITFMVH